MQAYKIPEVGPPFRNYPIRRYAVSFKCLHITTVLATPLSWVYRPQFQMTNIQLNIKHGYFSSVSTFTLSSRLYIWFFIGFNPFFLNSACILPKVKNNKTILNELYMRFTLTSCTLLKSILKMKIKYMYFLSSFFSKGERGLHCLF